MNNKELIFINGEIITLSEKKERAKSIIIKNGKIAEIDPDLPNNMFSTDEREVINLKGKTLIPGMSDCHVHFTHVGLGLIFPDFREVTSVSDLLDVLTDSVKRYPKGQVLLGWNFDENLFREKRFPTIEELDGVSAETPIWINRIGVNASVFNTKAWSMVNLPLSLSIIPTGPRRKVLGRIAGDANSIALAKILNSLNDEVRMEAFQAAAAHCATKGITSVHAMEGCFSPNMFDRHDFACLEIPCLIKNKNLIDLDIALWYQHIVNYKSDIALVKKYGLPRIAGDVFTDGVLGAAVAEGVIRAALFDPYYDTPSARGDLLFSDHEIEEFIWLAWEADLQFSAHAVGDRAFAQLMTGYQKAYEKKQGDGRFRIEHCILPDRTKFGLAAELGIIFSMQPAFDHYSGGPNGRYAQRLGPERVHLTNPFQDIINAGCIIVGGSDAPVNPIDPIFGIHSMVNHHYVEQRTSSLDALKAFTINAAYSAFEDDKTGSIEVGKKADMAVLSGNPLTVEPTRIKDIQVKMTVRNGMIIFRTPNFY